MSIYRYFISWMVSIKYWMRFHGGWYQGTQFNVTGNKAAKSSLSLFRNSFILDLSSHIFSCRWRIVRCLLLYILSNFITSHIRYIVLLTPHQIHLMWCWKQTINFNILVKRQSWIDVESWIRFAIITNGKRKVLHTLFVRSISILLLFFRQWNRKLLIW